jgi:hypothetical protein
MRAAIGRAVDLAGGRGRLGVVAQAFAVPVVEDLEDHGGGRSAALPPPRIGRRPGAQPPVWFVNMAMSK